MDLKALNGLIHNIALLLSLGLLYDSLFLRNRIRNPALRNLLNGFFLALIAIGIMLTPVKLIPGVIFDARSILLGSAGLFLGTIPTTIAMTAAAVLRGIQGGGGMYMGIAVIVTSGLIGLLWRRFRDASMEKHPLRELLLSGLLVHLVMLACIPFLPPKAARIVFKQLSLIIVFVYPVGMTLLGLLLHRRHLLVSNEQLLREYFESTPDGIFIADASGRYLEVNPAASVITGYTREELLARQIPDIIPERDRDRAAELFSRLRSAGRSVGDTSFLRKDGTEGVWTVAAARLSNDRFLGIAKDITKRLSMEKELRHSLDEKDVLLRELYHRTKNNMQVISSMLQLQSLTHDTPEVRSVVKEMTSRIRTIALVHQKLYNSDNLSTIGIRNFMDDLFPLIVKSYGMDPGAIRFDTHIQDFNVLIDIAIPMGLIFNELISNSIKHALSETTSHLTMRITRANSGDISIIYRDNGPGLPEGFEYNATGTMGLRTLFNICEHQLGGEAAFSNDNGLVCKINFNEQIYRSRI